MNIVVSKCEWIETRSMTPGTYSGTWSGQVIVVPVPYGEFRLTTDDGVRGTVNVTVFVDAKGGILVKEKGA